MGLEYSSEPLLVMAHELDYRPDGSATMFSVRKTPWHRLGAVLNDAPDLSSALRLAGADFEVVKRPIVVAADEDEGFPTCSVRGSFAVTRADRHAVLGIVGERYTPLQNRDAFEILSPLLDTGHATLETGGVLRGGEDVWLMAKFALPDQSEARALLGEEVAPYFLIANNHAGRRGVLCTITPVRVVCANTLAMARQPGARGIGRAFTITHNANVRINTAVAAQRLYRGVCERLEHAARQYQLLKQKQLTMQQWRELVLDTAAPLPKRRPSERDGFLNGMWERAQGRRDRLTRLWESGTGHRGDASAWEAYQAVAESLDHDDQLWAAKQPLDRRVASLFNGRLGSLKNRVLQKLYDHCIAN